jgi:hypothetical protein
MKLRDDGSERLQKVDVLEAVIRSRNDNAERKAG